MDFHPDQATQTFVTVILPLAIQKPYTYSVPEEWIPQAQFGKRVEVQFGKSRHYSGVIIEVHRQAPEGYRPKPIIAVVDEAPIINSYQLKLWRWLADYYCCTLGEVMHAALPAHLKLASETRITLSPLYSEDFLGLADEEYLIAEALTIQEELSIEDVRGILGKKTVYPLIRSMLEKKVIFLQEDLQEKFRPKKVSCVRLAEPYVSDRNRLDEAFELLGRANRQVEALMGYLDLARKQDFIRNTDLYKKAGVDLSVLKAMAKKGVFELYEREVRRIGGYEEDTVEAEVLSPQQVRALDEIKTHWEKQNTVLLHGVTGSGKTRIYIELIQEALRRGEQVLYLLPEIALTTQITDRLQRIFGDDVAIYHSRLNNNERVELWNVVLTGKSVVLGVRSALFLPFQKLKLVIVDEEHDRSFKQQEPNPRYNARDAATYLAHLHNAKVLLGTATPSIESFFNAKKGKYGLVEMPERFGGIEMPEILVADAREAYRRGEMKGHFTPQLLDELKKTLENGEQAILFQNRRGFAPTYRCDLCGWNAQCIHCDVSLTYHKFHNNLKCHYCGYQANLPKSCPACGSQKLSLQGFGTEKIEDELKIYLPDIKIARMDLDTVRGKHALGKLINDFEEGRIDVLVGTQMVTKGLDFEKVGLVGILSADQLLQFPDFRSGERAFQLMTQVSGRAGRKHKQGKVIVQAFNTASPVLAEVLRHDYFAFFQRETAERQEYAYPPYNRLVGISLKHKKPATLNDATRLFDRFLKEKLGSRVIGPAIPYISRVRTYYLMDFLIKLEKQPEVIAWVKTIILDSIHRLHQEEGFSGVRVTVDVDPY